MCVLCVSCVNRVQNTQVKAHFSISIRFSLPSPKPGSLEVAYNKDGTNSDVQTNIRYYNLTFVGGNEGEGRGEEGGEGGYCVLMCMEVEVECE